MGLLAAAFAAPAPQPNPEPQAKPTFYTATYAVPSVAVAAPVVAADFGAPILYSDEYYYDPVGYYTAYANQFVLV